MVGEIFTAHGAIAFEKGANVNTSCGANTSDNCFIAEKILLGIQKVKI